ncbi:MAG: hypothetical protein M1343_02940 [Chloroflexi bacterium]|nr:hypothetical protein [Chloroflexota bacterium]MDA8188587.1 hypothetical protein [Dehalococcoidales bacterium]
MEAKEPFCWEIKNCGEKERAACSAYRARKNCWDVPGTAINSDAAASCETCPVILSRIARAIASAMGTAQRR